MRSLSPMFVLSLMLLMSLSPMALQSDLGERPEGSSAVPKALIDFEVTSSRFVWNVLDLEVTSSRVL